MKSNFTSNNQSIRIYFNLGKFTRLKCRGRMPWKMRYRNLNDVPVSVRDNYLFSEEAVIFDNPSFVAINILVRLIPIPSFATFDLYC